MKKKLVSAVTNRKSLLNARLSVQQALDLLNEMSEEERPDLEDLIVAVKALRMIESAPPGTPGRNLIGIASSTLKRIALVRLKRGLEISELKGK